MALSEYRQKRHRLRVHECWPGSSYGLTFQLEEGYCIDRGYTRGGNCNYKFFGIGRWDVLAACLYLCFVSVEQGEGTVLVLGNK